PQPGTADHIPLARVQATEAARLLAARRRAREDRRVHPHPSRRQVLTGGAAALASFRASGLPPAQAADFCAGKHITIVCGYPPGGGVDAGARLIAQHLPRFIPGAPGIIVQSMPGAGGLVAANYLYAKAERRGLVLGLPGRDWLLHPTLQLPGGMFEAMKYSFIGSTGASNYFGWIRADLAISSIGALKASPA